MTVKGRTICTVCNYIYEECDGVTATSTSTGTRFEELPEEWRCPDCGSEKTMFQPCSCVSIEIYESTKAV